MPLERYAIPKNHIIKFDENGKIVKNEAFVRTKIRSFSENFFFKHDADILVIKSQPADSFKYDLESYSAVLIMPYHSSTLNTENKHFQQFCQDAEKVGIPVFVIDYRSEFIYESTKLYDDLGIIRLKSGCLPEIYIKLWLSVSSGADIKAIMTE